MNYRTAYDREIDSAHCAIADCEMALNHSYTDSDKESAGVAMTRAQSALGRAVRMRDAWLAIERGDYESWDEFAAGFEPAAVQGVLVL